MSRSFVRLVPFLTLVLLASACDNKKPEAPKPAENPAAAAPAAPSSIAVYATPDQAVKGFFDAVNDKKYDAAWKSLSAKSQEKIIAMVAKDEKMKVAEVKALFDENKAPIQRGFWDSFRESSKTSQFAPSASYKAISENGSVAVVELSSGNVKLEIKTFKEGDGWKAGYIETFME